MFGIFDTPAKKLRKRIPSYFLPDFEAVEHAARASLPYYATSDTENELIVGFALAAWALNEHRENRRTLSGPDGVFVSNYGQNCYKLLRNKSYLAVELVDDLKQAGVIVPCEGSDEQ